MERYIVIKDWYNVEKGTIITKESNEYKLNVDGNTITFNEDTLSNKEFFEKYTTDPLVITNMDEVDEDEKEYRFRIQLDVKCNRDKLKNIEKFLRSNIEDILS